MELNIEPRTRPLDEALDPVAFVRSMNGTRRHMTASQRALAEVSINAWAKRGYQEESAVTTDSARTDKPGVPVPPATAEQMAEAAHVSTRTIEQAKAVVQRAAPAVVAGASVRALRRLHFSANGKIHRHGVIADRKMTP